MPVLTQIPEHYVTEFDTNWRHLVQQKSSRLRDYVTPEKVTGKEKTINQMGQLAMRRVTTRGAQTQSSDATLGKRWLRPAPYDLTTQEDEWDEEYLGQIVLPTSALMVAHVSAYERACDDVIIDALGGTSYGGETGTTPNTLGSGQQVAVDFVQSGSPTNSGLTLAKLIRAKSIFGKNEVDESDPLIIVVSQQQIDDLLNNVNEVKSSDYAQVKALVDGKIDNFMGFKWRRTQRLPLASGTGVRTCYAYAKSGLSFSDSGRQVHVDVLPTQSHSLQIRTVASLGAVRSEEEKVVQLFCDEVL